MAECYIRIPKPIIDERNSFTATASFRDGDTAQAPTTARYRLDCLSTGTKLLGWTNLSPAESIAIPITSENNRIVSASTTTGSAFLGVGNNGFEKKQLTLASDPGETTETRDVITWKVKNTRGFED